MSTGNRSTERSIIIQHKNARMRLNARDGKLFISLAKDNNTITMTLSIEEALVIATYLNSYAGQKLQSGLYIGSRQGTAGQGQAKGKKPVTTAPKQVENTKVEEEETGDEE
jgi:hypothetical protein